MKLRAKWPERVWFAFALFGLLFIAELMASARGSATLYGYLLAQVAICAGFGAFLRHLRKSADFRDQYSAFKSPLDG